MPHQPYMDGGGFAEEDELQQSEPLFSCRIDNAKVCVVGEGDRECAPTHASMCSSHSHAHVHQRQHQVVTATLASLSTGAKKDQYAQVEANQDGASRMYISMTHLHYL